MLLYILEIIGTIAFAASGALAAIKHRMDLSGVIVLAFVVGNGGGTIRDILLNTPIFWFSQKTYIWLSVIAALICFLLASGHKFKDRIASLNKGLLVFDAIGLGVFAIAGTQKALSLHVSPLVAAIMGVLSAVGGGVLRDMLCNDIPVIFRRELYATLALIGAFVYIGLLPYVNTNLAMFGSIIAITILRLLAIYKDWHLPMAK